MMTEVNGLFLKLSLIYVCTYVKQNILKIHAVIKTMFGSASLGEVSGNSCELIACLPSGSMLSGLVGFILVLLPC